MTTLADDKFEGRGLGTAGYDGALSYVETTLKSYGVEPAGENGGFRQRVPLRNSTVVENASFLKVTSKGGTKTLGLRRRLHARRRSPARAGHDR